MFLPSSRKGAPLRSIDTSDISLIAQPMNGRQYAPANSPNPLPSSYATQGQQDVKDSDHARSHVRDLSGSRGRGPALPSIAISNIQSQQANSTTSPRSQSSASAVRSPTGLNGTLERRPSATQSHYRQPSRAHSNYPQSRNAIFLASPATSPLSPDTPGSAISNASLPDFSNYTMIRRQTSVRWPGDSPSTTANNSMHGSSVPSTLGGDRDLGDAIDGTVVRRNDRTQTSKSRTGHSHHRSQSRHHQEQKSVGEYALHHLFNKVSIDHIYGRLR